MTAAVQSMSLPCQADPERWFDRAHQTHARAGCRSCPIRRWCAREALKTAASWGMWAGVWIDGRHDDAAPHLQAVATGTLARSAVIAAAAAEDRLPTPTVHSPTPLRRPDGSSRASSVAEIVLARSSGCCEVMSDGCRYTFDHLVSRRPTEADETPTPPSRFAACISCADMVGDLEPRLAARFGYHVDGGRDPAHVPFYWRRSRWVLLERSGWLTELSGESIAI